MGLVKCIGKGEVTRPLILPTRPQTIGVDDCYVLTALPGGLKYCFGFLLCFGFVSFAVVPGVKNTGSGSDSAITVWCGLKQHAFLSGLHLIACVQSGHRRVNGSSSEHHPPASHCLDGPALSQLRRKFPGQQPHGHNIQGGTHSQAHVSTGSTSLDLP